MEKTSLKKRITNWIKNNRTETVILAIILIVGAYFRLYRISEYMTFLGDEGRDVIVVRRLLVNADPILVGPGTSIGNMYLGPLYYYMMASALLLANFSPVGPAVMIALLGVATIYLVWHVAREWFPSPRQARGKLGSRQAISIAGLVAASLYAISPVVIIYSRSSWNPNIMPFFALLCIYSIWKIWRNECRSLVYGTKGYRKWLLVLGVSYAFVLQSHYLGLLLAPVIGIFWALTLLKILRSKLIGYPPGGRAGWKLPVRRSLGTGGVIANFLRNTLLSVVVFAGLMSPLVIFDAKHDWRNFTAIKKFFIERQTTVSARPWTAIPKLPSIASRASTSLLAATNNRVGEWAAIGMGIATFWLATTLLFSNVVRKKKSGAYFLLFVWLGVAFVGLGVYKQEIYDHYYGFFFTAPFLLIGGFVQDIVYRTKGKSIFVKLPIYFLLLVTFFLLLVINSRESPLKYPPNRQLQRTIEVTQKVVEEAEGKKFNLAVIAERNYEDAYQYFLELWGTGVTDIDAQRMKETVGDELFVVCELPREKCEPVNNPKAEIANFGWSKIDAEWEVGGVILYKLVHTR